MPLPVFVWTDKDSELLLNVILQYKTTKSLSDIDWESCKNKYDEILSLYKEEYLANTSEDNPQDKRLNEITRSVLVSKIKTVKSKFKQAVDSGKKSGYGRVVFLFYDICNEIWGGTPSIIRMDCGLESTEINHEVNQGPNSPESYQNIGEKRERLNENINDQSSKRPKKTLSTEALWLKSIEEDQKLKKRLLDSLERSENTISDHLHRLNDTIAHGFTMLSQALCQESSSQRLTASPLHSPPSPIQMAPVIKKEVVNNNLI